MDTATFRARFPEFRAASDTLVDAVITEATARIASETFGDLTDTAIGYLAAHLLATSPLGASQRLEDDKTETTYFKEYRALGRQTAIRSFVT